MLSLDRKKLVVKKSYSSVNLFIRSLIFSIISLTTIALYSLVTVCTFPFPVRYRHSVIRFYLRFYFKLLRVVCHIDYQVEGLEHIPKDHTGIIMSKHQSTWEAFFIPLLFHNVAPIAKKELLWVPFFGWGLAVAKPIAINRSKKSSAMQQIIQQGKEYLQEGRWILFFPEGTRVPYGVVGHYKLGGARLAAATGFPIIPIAHNAGRFWPRRKFIKQPGTVHFVIGPMIESKGRTPEELLAMTKDWIESTVTRISRLVDEPTR
jgi:1-acyl-sn-glycerol-3-phosphate acyltransferase